METVLSSKICKIERLCFDFWYDRGYFLRVIHWPATTFKFSARMKKMSFVDWSIISILLILSLNKALSVTHWVVTEDGRIEAEVRPKFSFFSISSTLIHVGDIVCNETS